MLSWFWTLARVGGGGMCVGGWGEIIIVESQGEVGNWTKHKANQLLRKTWTIEQHVGKFSTGKMTIDELFLLDEIIG